MGEAITGVNHVASLARDMSETVAFYSEVLDIGVKRIANDAPGAKHYCLDIGGGGTLDFFEAAPGTAEGNRSGIGDLNHLALTTEPAFIESVEQRLKDRSWAYRPEERAGQHTIYFLDPNGINLQLYPSTGGSRG
jgi:catechol 2,3-dioxygenase-like lactoylglutathione lyase family enzyme